MRRAGVGLGGVFLLATALAVCFVGTHAAAADVTLTYSDWHLAEDVWGKSLNQALDEFEKQNPGIKVQREPVALAQRDVKFTTAIRAGKGPDVFSLDSNPVKLYIQEGWVKDLTPFIEKEGGKKWLDDFYPISLQPLTEQGKVYGVPVNTLAMVYLMNKEMFKAANAKLPKSWNDFREVSKTLTRATQPGGPVDQWGTTLVMAQACFDLRFSVVLRGFGGDFLTPDQKRSALNTLEAKQAFTFIVDMILNDRSMPPGVAQVDCTAARRLFANKKVAMVIGTMFDPSIINGMNPKLDTWNVIEMIPVPQKAGAKSPIRSTLYQKSIFMNANTQHPEEAWKLLKYLTDEKRGRKWWDDSQLPSSRKSVNETYAPIKQNRFAQVVISEIPHATFLPLIPQWPEILETFRQALQAAVAGSKRPERALEDAHNQIESILARK